ncbi:hypothetical protein HID58_035488, partial [Brassica napus]
APFVIHLPKTNPLNFAYIHIHLHNFSMDKKKTVAPQSSSSSSSSSFDHIFGPRVSSPPSSSTTGLFNSIFPRPSEKRMLGRQMDFASRGGHVKYQSPSERGERSNKKDKKSYHNEETEPPCNLSSSIYYGGQENYSSTTTTTKDTGRFITNMHCMSCNPDFEQLLRIKRRHGLS